MTTGKRTITLKGGPSDGEKLDVPEAQATVMLMTNITEQGKYEEGNPDDPDVAVQHSYDAADGRYLGWKYV